MNKVAQNTPVYGEDTREPTAVIAARIPVSLMLTVDAVRSKDRDEHRQDTVRKALEAYVASRLAA